MVGEGVAEKLLQPAADLRSSSRARASAQRRRKKRKDAEG
jgi:hypothetical protein